MRGIRYMAKYSSVSSKYNGVRNLGTLLYTFRKISSLFRTLMYTIKSINTIVEKRFKLRL